MPDRILEYFYDWKICSTDVSMLFNLQPPPPSIDKNRLSDINYLCERIINFPDSTLMNSDVWYTIKMLRQRAFKKKNSADEDDLWKICKAIYGHGGKRKTEEGLKKLKQKIHVNINFFKEFLKHDRKNKSVEAAIQDFLAGNPADDETEEQGDKKVEADKYYQLIFYSYNRVYEILKYKLTDAEIFDFFEKAASNIERTNAAINSTPDGRPLTYLKTKWWYTLGPDMYEEFN